MPTLETPDGKPVEVTVDPDAVNAMFNAAMADNGPDEQAPPKRQPKPVPEADAPKPGRGRPAKAEKARTTVKAAGAPLDDKQRAQGVKGFAQIGAGIALLFGRATGNDAFKADAVTIANASDETAEACVQIAHADPKFAAALDKVCAAGPYGALFIVVIGMGTQCARNHKPSLVIPGTVDPAELLKAQETADVPAAA